MRDLTPKEVTDIYAVREELEVMAARILPFPVADRRPCQARRDYRTKHSAAVDNGDMLTVFYANLHFHQTLFGLCGNACLIETIERLAQKVYGIRSYANAFPEALDRVRRDHVDIVEALRALAPRRIDRTHAASPQTVAGRPISAPTSAALATSTRQLSEAHH